MSKVPLLLFSGGLDSTYMLRDRLIDTDVETLYVTAGQCENKAKEELAAREKIIAHVNATSQHKVRKDHVVKLDFDMYTAFADSAWVQPVMWLTGALKISDGDQRHTHLEVGYVTGDGILCRLHDIAKAWEHLQAFTKCNTIPIRFPLESVSKHEILLKLDPALYPLVWVCELPTVKRTEEGYDHIPCEKCVACHTHAAALFVFERKFGQSYADYFDPNKCKADTGLIEVVES